ncbi:hypothetical protein Salat_2693500 [Sesamum alatum]|uniref:Uncharacterized protein n=1 Tax=Sesamum alatum TaxID=300844 RepID=A0AAE1XQV7_9LAMI|nr:hypothetical protein Salat_2693500 [Sesamum alatum]
MSGSEFATSKGRSIFKGVGSILGLLTNGGGTKVGEVVEDPEERRVEVYFEVLWWERPGGAAAGRWAWGVGRSRAVMRNLRWAATSLGWRAWSHGGGLGLAGVVARRWAWGGGRGRAAVIRLRRAATGLGW